MAPKPSVDPKWVLSQLQDMELEHAINLQGYRSELIEKNRSAQASVVRGDFEPARQFADESYPIYERLHLDRNIVTAAHLCLCLNRNIPRVA